VTRYHGPGRGARRSRGRRAQGKRDETVEFRNQILPDLVGAGRFMSRWINRDVRKKADKGLGVGGKRQRRLKKRYAAQKAALGRKPIPDFRFSGQLMGSVRPKSPSRGADFIVVRVGPTGSRNLRVATLLEQMGRELFFMNKKDTARLVAALKKSGRMITNAKGANTSRPGAAVKIA